MKPNIRNADLRACLPSEQTKPTQILSIENSLSNVKDSPMKTYNVGVIGYGWVAGAHIAAINATGRAKVTSIYSSRPLKESEVSAKHGGAIRTFTNFEQFLSDESIDVVSICSYPQD